MPEPNLPPLRLSLQPHSNRDILNIPALTSDLPELPNATRSRLISDLKLNVDNACRLVNKPLWLDFFEKAVEVRPKEPNVVASLLVVDLIGLLGIKEGEEEGESKDLFEDIALTPKNLAELADLKVKKKHFLRAHLHMTKNLLTNIRRISVDEEFLILINFFVKLHFLLHF